MGSSLTRRLVVALALTVALAVSSALAQTAEVTSLDIRALSVADDGTLKLVTSFRTADNQPVSTPDLGPLGMELDGSVRSVTATSTDFESSGQGLGVVIAVDISGSMKKAMPEIRRHLAWYAHQLDPSLDQAAVGTIGNEWTLVLPFTNDMDKVATTIESIDAHTKTTALFESVYEGVDLLKRQGTSFPARRLMIIITDGQNEKIGRTVSDCVSHANASHVQVHSLIFLTSQRETYLEAIGETEKLSRDTGGEVRKTDNPDEIQQAVEDLRSELLAETVLTIPGSNLINDGLEHDLVLLYGGASDRIRYRSPRPNGGPGPEPATPDDDDATTTTGLPVAIIAGIAAVGLLFLLVLVIALIWWRRRVAFARELERKLAEEAKAPPPRPPEPDPPPMVEPQEPEPPTEQEFIPPPAIEPPPPQPEPDPPQAETTIEPPQPAPPSKSRKTVYRPPPTDAPQVTRFRVLQGFDEATELQIPPQGASIGADPGNHIVITAQSVSSFHAEVVPAAAGMAIRDMGSTNGTFVNTVRVEEGELVMLSPGCQVQIGLVVLEFLE